MSEHITRDQWLHILADNEYSEIRISAMNHMAQCEQCHKMLDILRRTQRFIRQQHAVSNDDAYGYAAVAAMGGSNAGVNNGLWAIDLVKKESGWNFDMETMESSGLGNMLAMNPSADGHSMTDDGGLISISIQSDQLTIEMQDDEHIITVTAIAGNARGTVTPDPVAEILLP